MTDKTLGAYQRTTPDPDETTGEALARLQAEMTRLLDEADAELRDEADGGVTASLIEKEAENADPTVDYHAMWWKAEREREKAERERDEARATKDMHKRRADEERARADQAEKERDEMRDAWEGAVEAVKEANALISSLRAAEPRPLTPDAVPDGTVEQARAAWINAGGRVYPGLTLDLRHALAAALIATGRVHVDGEEDPR